MLRSMLALLLMGTLAFWSLGCAAEPQRTPEPGSPPDAHHEPGSPPDHQPRREPGS